MDDDNPELLPAYEALAAFGEECSRSVTEWFGRISVAFEGLGEVLNRPEVRAAIEDARAQPRPRPCYCLCPRLHPGDKGVCDGEGVTTRRFTTKLTGPVDVSLCAPCAVAQGLAELTGPAA